MSLALSAFHRAGCGALLSLAAACGSARPPAASATPPAELAPLLYEATHSCEPALTAANASAQPAPEVFVEAVLLDVPKRTKVSAANISELAFQPGVQLLGMPHLSGKLDSRVTSTLEQHLGLLARPTLSQISLVTKNYESDQYLLEFELGFSMPNDDPKRNPQLARTAFVVHGPSDHALLGSADHPGDPERQVLAIVKAYPFRAQDDLRKLFECKMRLHSQAAQHR